MSLTVLGIDQPAGQWPTVPRLKAYEAAGFSHVQVRMPPRSVLGDPSALGAHARGLREMVDLTGLRLILHAPDDLLAGSRVHDRQLEGGLEYAALSGAELLVYHGAAVPLGGAGCGERLEAERRSLRRRVSRAATLGVRLAIENLAPTYAGDAALVSHDPRRVGELVRALDTDLAGVCLDLGHAHIVACLAGCPIAELIEPVLDEVILFHAHDNHGGRTTGQWAGSIEPVRLDLHLAPGAGSLPWAEVAGLLATHAAPVQLEVFAPGRPEPGTLAVLARELLGRRTDAAHSCGA
jgi:sugar phosphate isomerase/epimerase